MNNKRPGPALRLAAAALAIGMAAGMGSAWAAKPNPLPECFKPWDDDTPTISYPEREGPYRVALANGFAGNDWRIEMIQSLKAWAKRPENAKDIEELKIVSTGTDVAAQISAIDNMIAAGFDAIIFIAVNPTAFTGVIKRAARAGTVLVPFDNILDTQAVVQLNEPQLLLEGTKAQAVVKHMVRKSGKVLEVRGLPGNSVDRDRSIGMHQVFDPIDDVEVVTVVGNWDTGTVQKVVADAIATHGHFDGMVLQHGTVGAINAMLNAGHPLVPIGGDGENGARKLMVKHNVPGASVTQAPAMSAIAMQAAIALLKGHDLPAMIALPLPYVLSEDLEEGVNYFPDLPDTINLGSGFAECGRALTAEEVLAETAEDA